VLPTFAVNFIDLIFTELQQASKGAASPHHVHNVQSGIANILALLEHNDEIADAADRLGRVATRYINRHTILPITGGELETSADAARLSAALAALEAFCVVLEGARPNSRVRVLGLEF
jgi:hypothetical protein